jgi:hypothetical protein
MAAGQKLYPRATLKKIVKAHSKKNVSKNVDVLVCLTRPRFDGVDTDQPLDLPRLCALFANVCSHYPLWHYCGASTDIQTRLMKEASINAKQAGERGISAKNVKKVTEVSVDWHSLGFTDTNGLLTAYPLQIQGIRRLRRLCMLDTISGRKLFNNDS